MKASPDPTSPNWRHDFLSFCVDCDVLRFGEFTLKSGRSSPYFFNAGLFNTGGRLATLGKYYARAIVDSGVDVIPAGTAIRESASLVAAQGATLAGVVVALDREERGADTELTAIGQVRAELGVPVVPIVTLKQLIEYLEASGKTDEASRLRAHRKEFGPKEEVEA